MKKLKILLILFFLLAMGLKAKDAININEQINYFFASNLLKIST